MKRTIICTGSLALLLACSKTPQISGHGFVSTATASVRPVATSGSATTPAVSAAPAELAAPVTASAAASASASSTAADYREITLPAGTILPVSLETSVASDTSRVEQAVQGRLRHAVTSHGVEVLPAGTALSGNVTAVRRPGKVRGLGYIAMRFTRLDTPGAGTTRISTASVSRTGRATKEKDALKIVAPAAAGAVIGRIAGGKSGAAKGAVIGGAGGTGYVLATRGEDVRLAKGTPIGVTLTAPLTVRVPVAR
jgi:hypothetical protein